jgi:hypothetical protein
MLASNSNSAIGSARDPTAVTARPAQHPGKTELVEEDPTLPKVPYAENLLKTVPYHAVKSSNFVVAGLLRHLLANSHQTAHHVYRIGPVLEIIFLILRRLESIF